MLVTVYVKKIRPVPEGNTSFFILNVFSNQITQMWKCRKSIFAYWGPTWGSLVDRLYQIIEAQALGSWLTLEIITTGKELVWWREWMQCVNAAEESISAVLCFGFLASLSSQMHRLLFPEVLEILWLLLRASLRVGRPVVWPNTVVLLWTAGKCLLLLPQKICPEYSLPNLWSIRTGRPVFQSWWSAAPRSPCEGPEGVRRL